MLRNYKYRLYPNRKQKRLLNRLLELHRRLYNAALEQRIWAWKHHKKSVSCYAQGYEIKEIREEDEDYAWCNHNALKRTLRRLDKSYQAFFRRIKMGDKAGFPKFKGKQFFNSVEYTYNNGIRLKGDRLYVQELGEMRMFLHRPIPEDSKIKAALLKREGYKWYVVFSLELPDNYVELRDGPSVGIDMGLEVFCALSDGELVENPRWFRGMEEKLGILQKRRARCKKGSKQYRQLSRQITNLHAGIANKRHDFHNQLSTRLVRDYGLIAVEDLSIKGLARSHVSKSMADVGWGRFLNMLEYKAIEHGSRFYKVDARNTSQVCSDCGCVVKKDLSERIHKCHECGYIENRDVNAARNVLQRALSERTGTDCVTA